MSFTRNQETDPCMWGATILCIPQETRRHRGNLTWEDNQGLP